MTDILTSYDMTPTSREMADTVTRIRFSGAGFGGMRRAVIGYRE
jgi:hypothetical protein